MLEMQIQNHQIMVDSLINPDATAQGSGSFMGPSGSFYAWYYGEGSPTPI